MKKVLWLIIGLVLMQVAFADTYVFETGQCQSIKSGNYDIIICENTDLLDEQFQLEVPQGTKVLEFDKGGIIKEITLKKVSDATELTLNIPMVDYDAQGNSMYVEKECIRNTEKAYIDPMTPTYGEKTNVRVDFYPLEMVDCETGLFKLYEKMEIEIEFEDRISFSVERTSELIPEKDVTYVAHFDETPNGEISVEGRYGLIETFEAKSKTVEMTFTTTLTELQEYTFDYYEGDELLATQNIEEDLSWGNFDFRVLESEDKTIFPLAIEITNDLQEEISLDLQIMSTNLDGDVQTTMNTSIKAKPGIGIYYIDFKVTEEERNNNIDIIGSYKGISLLASHNTFVRFKKEETQSGLPPPPGEELIQEMAKVIQEEASKTSAKKSVSSRLSTTIAIIVSVLLTALVIYIIFKYMRTKPED